MPWREIHKYWLNMLLFRLRESQPWTPHIQRCRCFGELIIYDVCMRERAESRETMHRRTTGSMFDLCTQHSSSALLQGMHIARPMLLTLSISGRNAMQRAKRHRLCIAIIIICREKLLVHRKLSRHPQCKLLVRTSYPPMIKFSSSLSRYCLTWK